MPSAASAQENILKVNVLSPAVRTGSLFYEYAFGRNATLQFGLLYTGMKNNETVARGFAFTPEYRYYLSKKKSVLKGAYVAGYLRYQNLGFSKDRLATYTFTDTITGITTTTEVNETAEAELVTWGGGVLIGTQTIFKNKLTLDAFIGPGYNSGDVEHKDEKHDVEFNTKLWHGITIRFGVAIGLAF